MIKRCHLLFCCHCFVVFSSQRFEFYGALWSSLNVNQMCCKHFFLASLKDKWGPVKRWFITLECLSVNIIWKNSSDQTFKELHILETRVSKIALFSHIAQWRWIENDWLWFFSSLVKARIVTQMTGGLYTPPLMWPPRLIEWWRRAPKKGAWWPLECKWLTLKLNCGATPSSLNHWSTQWFCC